jgi:hypothetical protein
VKSWRKKKFFWWKFDDVTVSVGWDMEERRKGEKRFSMWIKQTSDFPRKTPEIFTWLSASFQWTHTFLISWKNTLLQQRLQRKIHADNTVFPTNIEKVFPQHARQRQHESVLEARKNFVGKSCRWKVVDAFSGIGKPMRRFSLMLFYYKTYPKFPTLVPEIIICIVGLRWFHRS